MKSGTSFSTKKPGFRDYIQALKLLGSDRGVNNNHFFFIYGKAPWLEQEAVRTLRQSALRNDLATATLEGKEVSENMLNQMFSQSSLFEPATLYIINKAEQAKPLLSALTPGKGKESTSENEIANKIVLVFSGDKMPAAIAPLLSQKGSVDIPCFAPWPNEMPRAIENFAELEGLRIDNDGIQAILETLGNDLQKIKNELVRIALHYADEAEKTLTRSDIAPFLGALKEEDIYQLDRYLLEKKWALAHALIVSLLERGEKPLSVLAMLSNHCRNVLNICDGMAKGFTASEISARTRLPQFIMKNYLQAVKGVPVSGYNAALAACHRADRTFKSRPLDQSLVLAGIISHLAEPSIRANQSH